MLESELNYKKWKMTVNLYIYTLVQIFFFLMLEVNLIIKNEKYYKLMDLQIIFFSVRGVGA
jgi:hypothetical protein